MLEDKRGLGKVQKWNTPDNSEKKGGPVQLRKNKRDTFIATPHAKFQKQSIQPNFSYMMSVQKGSFKHRTKPGTSRRTLTPSWRDIMLALQIKVKRKKKDDGSSKKQSTAICTTYLGARVCVQKVCNQHDQHRKWDVGDIHIRDEGTQRHKS